MRRNLFMRNAEIEQTAHRPSRRGRVEQSRRLVGLLTCGSSSPKLPSRGIPSGNCVVSALHAYSGWAVPDSHRLPKFKKPDRMLIPRTNRTRQIGPCWSGSLAIGEHLKSPIPGDGKFEDGDLRWHVLGHSAERTRAGKAIGNERLQRGIELLAQMTKNQ